MNAEEKSYTIYDQKTGHPVAVIRPDGIVQNEGDPQAVTKLKTLMQREIVVQESLLNANAEKDGEEYDPYPEENMCYFGLITLRPGDPSYLAAFIRRLPYISFYEAHLLKE